MPDFFSCYLLQSRSMPLKTYVGFTTNPIQRIRQHNGEIVNGAQRTKTGRPWDMLMVVYGFCNKKHALQFEWALQHPAKSLATKDICAAIKKKRLSGAKAHVRFVAEMLNVNPWRMYPLTVQVLHEKCEDYWKDTRPLPSHIRRVTLPPEALPLPKNGTQQEDDDEEEDEGTVSEGSAFDGGELAATSSPLTCDASTQQSSGAQRQWMSMRSRYRVVPALAEQDELAAIDALYGVPDACDAEGAAGATHLGLGDTVHHGSQQAPSAEMDDDASSGSLGSGAEEPHSVTEQPQGVRPTRDGLTTSSPGKCSECRKPLMKNFFPCPGCGKYIHDECWAPYLRQDECGAPLPSTMVLPSHGNCPECEALVSWVQVLQGSLSVRQHNRVQRKRGPGKRSNAKAQAAPDSRADIETQAQVSGRGRGRGRGRGTTRQRTTKVGAPSQGEAHTAPGPSPGVGRGSKAGSRGGRGRGGRRTHRTAAATAASGLSGQHPAMGLQGAGLRDCSTAALVQDTACALAGSDDEQADAAALNALYGVGGDVGGEACDHSPVGTMDAMQATAEHTASPCIQSSGLKVHETVAAENDDSAAGEAVDMHQDNARGRKNLFASLQGTQVETFSYLVPANEEIGRQSGTQTPAINSAVDEVQCGGQLGLGSSGICEPVSFQPRGVELAAVGIIQPCSPGAGECMVDDLTREVGIASVEQMFNSSQGQCARPQALLNTENAVPGTHSIQCEDDTSARLGSVTPEVMGSTFELPPTPMSCTWSPEMQPTGDETAGCNDVCMQSTTPILGASCRYQASPSRSQMSPLLAMHSSVLVAEGLTANPEQEDAVAENSAQLQAPRDTQGPSRGKCCTAGSAAIDDEMCTPCGMHTAALAGRNGSSGDNCCDDDKSARIGRHAVQSVDRLSSVVINLLT